MTVGWGLGDSDSPSVGVIVGNPLPGSGVVKAGVGARVEYFGGRVGMIGFSEGGCAVGGTVARGSLRVVLG